ASAILTILILLFSEIIPKTIGAYYWRGQVPSNNFSLHYLVIALTPVVYLLQQVTRLITPKNQENSFSRSELMAMTELGLDSGSLSTEEFKIINNLFELRQIKLNQVMTPRTVIYTVSKHLTVEAFFFQSMKQRFSRIPVYDKYSTDIVGFVLRSDLLLAQARGNSDELLENYMRSMPVLLESMSVLHTLNQMTTEEALIALVVNEYGDVEGIVTMEDILETLLGLEIVDESDAIDDMQKLVKGYIKKRESLQQQND
ncbi:MAG: CBS domain-containing protein, partial [Gammaproteobacteria bacterium]|nr:CBS domain-containing protein [Gammaproteobacteria bacterium]